MSKFIFTGDWHLRNDKPINRIDDFEYIQLESLKFIAKKAKENKATIVIAGDIFHKAKAENMQELINQLYDIFKNNRVVFIAGNHDLLFHSMSNFEKCNIGILTKFNNWQLGSLPYYFNYGQEIKNTEFKIAVLHKYCEKDNLPSYISDGITAKLLTENYNYDIFVVGDNHQSFIYKNNDKIVFNTGCCTRQNLNEKDYKPSIILFDSDTREYEQIFLPDNKENVFREDNFKKEIKERNDRINSFVELASNQENISLNFESNIKKYCLKNKVKDEIVEEINNIME